jgi:thiol-disulfide isomerase/thioredoxin
MLKKKNLWNCFFLLIMLIALFSFSGCSPQEISVKEDSFGNEVISSAEDWKNIPLKDIRTGETFTIGQFKRPILLESFAVWCPTCTKQQNVIKDLHKELGDDVVSISLDTDPNEDEERVREHIKQNNFNWYYAVSPVSLTKKLIDEFGVGIVNAPSAPVVIICNGQDRKLGRGVKSVEELKEALAIC